MPQHPALIDTATRFLRTNPDLLALAQQGARDTGQPVEVLLTDAVRRIRRSGFEAITKEQVVAGPSHRLQGRLAQSARVGSPATDHPRPRLVVLAS
jgi:hypothetical protein